MPAHLYLKTAGKAHQENCKADASAQASCVWQVAKSAKDAVKRKAKGSAQYADDAKPADEAPQWWNNYNVHFQSSKHAC